MANVERCLQIVYWISQISLPFIAIIAGWVGLRHYQTFRLFEILRHLETGEVRQARRVVMAEIAKPENHEKEWWTNPDLQIAAAQVAASYDHLSVIIQFHGMGRVERTFLRRYGEGIVRAYMTLQPYLLWRRVSGPASYIEFDWLYNEAKKLFPNVSPPVTM